MYVDHQIQLYKKLGYTHTHIYISFFSVHFSCFPCLSLNPQVLYRLQFTRSPERFQAQKIGD